MTPKTCNYVDLELSYDHFSDANGSISKKMKKKLALKSRHKFECKLFNNATPRNQAECAERAVPEIQRVE